MNKIIADTGAESKYILESADAKIKSETSLKTLLKDIYQLSESFNKEKVKTVLKNKLETVKGLKITHLSKSLLISLKYVH